MQGWLPVQLRRVLYFQRAQSAFTAHLRTLEREAELPPAAQRAAQTRRLRRLLELAHREVPFQRQRMLATGATVDDLVAPGGLSALPPVRKTDLRDLAREELVAGSVRPSRRKARSTSGSTGERFVFFKVPLDTILGAAARASTFHRAGFRGGPVVEIFASPNATGGRERVPAQWARHTISYQWPISRQAEVVERVAPLVIYGNRSNLLQLGEALAARGSGLVVPGVFSTAETLLDGDRRRLEELFGGAVHDQYGVAEVGLVASQEHPAGPYRSLQSKLVVEVLDGGRPAAPGTTGEIVVTDLFNTVMPFIRYATGDLAQVERVDDDSGQVVELRHVEGRMDDCLATADGTIVSPWQAVNASLWGVPTVQREVRQWQVTQDADKRVVVRIVPHGEALSVETTTTVVDRLRQALGPVPVEVVEVRSIPGEPHGKFRPVKSAFGRQPTSG